MATCWFITSTPLFIFTFEANVDSIFVAAYLIAVYFFVSFLTSDDGIPALLLGSLAAGLALGTKPVGVVFIPPLLLLALGAAAVRTRSLWRALVPGVVMLACVVVPSGFWYVRNIVLTGNPLYPLRVAIFGSTIFQGCYGREAMQFSPYYLPPAACAHLSTLFWPCSTRDLSPSGLPRLQASGRFDQTAGTRPTGGSGQCRPCALNVALWWICIPYRTQQRFFLQAVGLAAVPLARLLDRNVWLGRCATALLALHLLTPQPWPLALRQDDIPWDMSPIIPNLVPAPLRLLRLVERSGRPVLEFGAISNVLLLAGAGGFALAAVWAWTRPHRSTRRRWTKPACWDSGSSRFTQPGGARYRGRRHRPSALDLSRVP